MSEELGINVATEQRFLAHKGKIFANAAGGNGFWLRYLDIFSWVRVIARVQQIDSLPDAAVPITDTRIKFACLPGFQGPSEMIKNLSLLWSLTKKIAQDDGAFILRVPGLIGSFLYWHLRSRHWPYAVEVVGDPYDSLDQQAIGKSWARTVRPIAVLGMQQQCRNAAAASYVTKTILQQRYPSQAGFTTYYSSIELSDDLIHLTQAHKRTSQEKNSERTGNIPTLIFVGSLSQRYKGLHVLLHALEICKLQNFIFKLEILGDGAYRTEYEHLAIKLGLDEVVKFHGFVKQGEEVFQILCAADLLVMPSLMEGLPRAMIEAMACGLPCIGSRIGGIPELLESEDMVTPGDAQSLAKAILDMLNNPERMQRTGKRNRQIALEYRSDVLRPRREQFYGYLRDITLERRQLRVRKS